MSPAAATALDVQCDEGAGLPTAQCPEDFALERRIVSTLAHWGIEGIDTLKVTACHGTVVLEGTGSSMRDLCLCAACCRRISGVVRVINCLVRDGEEPDFDAEGLSSSPA